MSQEIQRRMRGGKLIYVKWYDAAGHGRWQDFVDAYQDAEDVDRTLCVCETVGWVVRSGPKTLTIAGERSTHGSVSNQTRIPKSCIIERCDIED